MSNTEKKPSVSVIIPVFNDRERLGICLQALEKQTYPKECYETIVVDNASEEDIASITNQVSHTILAYESKQGSYAARNKGITVAKGEILAFTDSDCIPALNWIEKGVENLLKAPNCGLVAGKIELFFKIPDRPTALELYDAITYLDQKQHVNRRKFGATANMFTFASRFQNIGLFDGGLTSGGDMEWGKRLSSKGYEVIYAEDVCVKHPARSSLRELHRKTIRVVRGHYNQGENIGLYNRTKGDLSLIKEIFQRLKPPIKYLRWRLSDNRLRGKKQKLLLAIAIVSINYVIAWEVIKLRVSTKS